MFVVFLGCKKSNDAPLNETYETVDYQTIYLDSHLRIVKVISSSQLEKLNWHSDYFYNDSTVRVITVNQSSGKEIIEYKLGENGFAISAEDSVWTSDTNFYSHSYRYFYDSVDYINSIEFYGATWLFSERNGDLIRYMTFYNNTYFDTLNKIDIFWQKYYNGIAGKINKHITKSISGYFGLGAGYYRSFSYVLYPDGYIKERHETMQSSNGDFQKRTYSYHLTNFKYVFNYTP